MPAVVISVVRMAWSAGTLVYGDIDCDVSRAVRGSAWRVRGVAVRGTWGVAGGGAVGGAGCVAAAIGCKAGGGAGDEPGIIHLNNLVTTLSEQTSDL